MAKYDFTNYYKQAYLQEKSKNIQLANEAASKEQAVLELRQKYERIAGNPVIRLLHGVKKAPAKLKKRTIKIEDTVCGEDSVSVKQYEKELLFQKNPYTLWISEHEKALQAGESIVPETEGQKKETGSSIEVVYLEECGRDFSVADISKSYILFVSKNGTLNGQTLKVIEECFDNRKDAHIIYGAEDVYFRTNSGEKERKNPWFKPAYSPETLLSFFYFGNVFAIRKDAVAAVKWLSEENWKENIYDFVLKTEEVLGEQAKAGIVALDKILFHWDGEQREEKTAIAADDSAITGIWGYEKEFEKVKLAALERRGMKGFLEESNVPGVYSVCIEETEKVSIVILSKDNPKVLEQCISSIREKTDYDNMEIIVVDNGSLEENKLKVEALSEKYEFTYICEPMEFNFSAMCNIGAKAATGKYLLLLNDDMEVIESGWLKRMAGQAAVEGVGAVGAKLWYPDSLKIQHAGITNLSIGPAHKLVTSEDDRMYYDGRNYFTFNYLAVTGACLLIRKKLYDELGGMDESMPVAYNDVEFCFRLHQKGYRNVLRNDCILFHHESLSRGLDEENEEKAARLLEERKRLYRKYPAYAGTDEYYSPWLTQNSPEYKCSTSVTVEETLKPLMENGGVKKGKQLSEEVLAANIENVHLKDGKVQIRGWSIVKGADNCHYKRSLILYGTESKKIYTSEVKAFLREDVTQVFPQERRIELAGFLAGFSVKTVENGTYKIGILYEDMLSDNIYYRMTEHCLEIN